MPGRLPAVNAAAFSDSFAPALALPTTIKTGIKREVVFRLSQIKSCCSFAELPQLPSS
jgi:hypothetical protein